MPSTQIRFHALVPLLVASVACSASSPALDGAGGDLASPDALLPDAAPPGADAGPDIAPPDAMLPDAAPPNPVDRYAQIPTVRTIGKSAAADFDSFGAAIADLAASPLPAGGVLFRVEPGSYPERFTVPALAQSAADRPVVFAADGGAVSVVGKGTDATDDAMITLDACDHLTFDSIDVEDGGSTSADRVELGYFLTGSETDGASHNTLRGCAIRLGGGSSEPVPPLSKGIFVRGKAPDPQAVAATCSHNRFEDLRVDRAAEGITLRGATKGLAGELMAPDEGNVVAGCVIGALEPIGHDDDTVNAAVANGISVSNNAAGEISGNVIHAVEIRKAKPLIPTAISGISAREFSGEIHGNRVLRVRYEGEKGSQVAGIRATRRGDGPLRIYNNFISGLSRSPYPAPGHDPTIYVNGIRLFSTVSPSTTVIEVAHNTVLIETPANAAYATTAVNISGGSSGKFAVELRDNILVNRSQATDPAGSSFAIVDGNTDRQYLVSDHNLLQVTGPQAHVGVVGRELGGEVASARTLAEWQAASGQDAASQSKPVTFADAAAGDLHLKGASAADSALRGVPIAFVGEDIDGDARDPSAPSLGADEVP